MASWDIQPDGVRAILGRVDGEAENLAAAKSFGTDVESAANAAGSSIIMSALTEFATAQTNALGQLGDLVRSAEEGAVGATNAYLYGDDQMAQNSQRAAAVAAGLILPNSALRAGRRRWQD
jgi:hypothetical protein